MKHLFYFSAIAVALGVCAPAHATIITSVSAGPDTAGQTFGSATFLQVVAGNGTTPGVSPNTITLNATLESGYVANSPLDWSFDFVEADGDSNLNGNTKYFVTVNITNNASVPFPTQVFTLGPPVETLNLFASTAGPNSFVSPSSPAPTSSFNFLSGNGFKMGVPTLGFSNGPDFAIGNTETFTFTLDLADYVNASNTSVVAGSFVLSMVANPEPASLALAGLALSAAAGGRAVRRRRKKAAVPQGDAIVTEAQA